jgi:hypothetical protein
MEMTEDNGVIRIVAERSPFRILAEAVARGIDRFTEPVRDPWIDLMMNVSQVAVQVITSIQSASAEARRNVRIEGVEEEQVRREFDADEAALKAEYHAKRARLVADYGVRFVEARASDAARDEMPALAGGAL